MILAPALLVCALLPIHGYGVIAPGRKGLIAPALLGPQMRMDPPLAHPGSEVHLYVTDYIPWTHVLIAINGISVRPDSWGPTPDGRWTWRFPLWLPAGSSEIVFYHSCDAGCREYGRMILGEIPSPPPVSPPTKLGLVFPNPGLAWPQRLAVEVTYARLEDR